MNILPVCVNTYNLNSKFATAKFNNIKLSQIRHSAVSFAGDDVAAQSLSEEELNRCRIMLKEAAKLHLHNDCNGAENFYDEEKVLDALTPFNVQFFKPLLFHRQWDNGGKYMFPISDIPGILSCITPYNAKFVLPALNLKDRYGQHKLYTLGLQEILCMLNEVLSHKPTESN